MVQLVLTPAGRIALQEYSAAKRESETAPLDGCSNIAVGDPVDHHRLIEASRYLINRDRNDETASKWRLDGLLRGAVIYKSPPPSRPEPVSLFSLFLARSHVDISQTPQYKALMQKLRQQEEQRQYERMINPLPPVETFKQRFPNSPYDFDPATSHGQSATYDVVDEVTYADVNRQMILIINVLVSIVACSIAIWIAARRWSVPQRLALSLSGSSVVAIAEVAIYLGYIKRIEDAKAIEAKVVEQKQVVESWVIEKTVAKQEADRVRFRKGKHR
nr:hypothetical protein CFP56_67800 [Quercus suber]